MSLTKCLIYKHLARDKLLPISPPLLSSQGPTCCFCTGSWALTLRKGDLLGPITEGEGSRERIPTWSSRPGTPVLLHVSPRRSGTGQTTGCHLLQLLLVSREDWGSSVTFYSDQAGSRCLCSKILAWGTNQVVSKAKEMARAHPCLHAKSGPLWKEGTDDLQRGWGWARKQHSA